MKNFTRATGGNIEEYFIRETYVYYMRHPYVLFKGSGNINQVYTHHILKILYEK